jgi:NTE family protein
MKIHIKMSKVITRYLKYIDELYQIIDKNIDTARIEKKQLEKIRRTYIKTKRERGADIREIIHVTRDEPYPLMEKREKKIDNNPPDKQLST